MIKENFQSLAVMRRLLKYNARRERASILFGNATRKQIEKYKT